MKYYFNVYLFSESLLSIYLYPYISEKHFYNIILSCNDNEKVAQTPSSDEDNSPTELNSCKRLADKPPLVS